MTDSVPWHHAQRSRLQNGKVIAWPSATSYTKSVDDAVTRLTALILNALLSFTGTALYLVELYLAKKFVDELKLENVFKRVTALVRFILALIIASLAFSLINSYPGRYLGIIFGSNVPLTKIFTLLEAIVFFWLLYRLFRNRNGTERKPSGLIPPPPVTKKTTPLRRSWEEE